MSQELTDAEWLRELAEWFRRYGALEGVDADQAERDVDRLHSIADRLERPGVEAWLKFEGPGNWHLETSVTTAEVQRIFGEFPDVVQNRVRITIEPVKTL